VESAWSPLATRPVAQLIIERLAMNRAWKVGDRFQFVWGEKGLVQGATGTDNWIIGSYGTILRLDALRAGWLTVSSDLMPYHRVDMWGGWGVHPSWIKPIDQERHEGTWETCVFQPKEMDEAVESRLLAGRSRHSSAEKLPRVRGRLHAYVGRDAQPMTDC
jgi:hypothetical protein